MTVNDNQVRARTDETEYNTVERQKDVNHHSNENDSLDLMFTKEVDAVNALMAGNNNKIEIKHSTRYQKEEDEDCIMIPGENSALYNSKLQNNAFVEFELINKSQNRPKTQEKKRKTSQSLQIRNKPSGAKRAA